jgi:hypothetical protein
VNARSSVLRLGLTNEEIAARLGDLAGRQVPRLQILSKLGVATREEATVAIPEPLSRSRGFQPGGDVLVGDAAAGR